MQSCGNSAEAYPDPPPASWTVDNFAGKATHTTSSSSRSDKGGGRGGEKQGGKFLAQIMRHMKKKSKVRDHIVAYTRSHTHANACTHTHSLTHTHNTHVRTLPKVVADDGQTLAFKNQTLQSLCVRLSNLYETQSKISSLKEYFVEKLQAVATAVYDTGGGVVESGGRGAAGEGFDLGSWEEIITSALMDAEQALQEDTLFLSHLVAVRLVWVFYIPSG